MPEMDGKQFPAEEEYHSASDEDFNPDAPSAEHEVAESSSAQEEQTATAPKRSRDDTAAEADNAGFENSGDEATIQSGRKKKRKIARGPRDEGSDEGGEGGLVKTRAQRKAEVKEKKPLKEASKASVDVDSLWSQMAGASRPCEPPSQSEPKSLAENGTSSTQDLMDSEPLEKDDTLQAPSANGAKATNEAKSEKTNTGEGTITIKRKYDFAGQTMEEERVVPASSAEAKLHQASNTGQGENGDNPTPKPALRRPTRKKAGFSVPGPGDATLTPPSQAKKLNTLEKSKMDWAAHVDKEGIGEELDEHSRAKEGYLGRMDFLGRMVAKREQDLTKGPT